MLTKKLQIPTVADVVVHRDYEKWSCVSRGVRISEFIEPTYQSRGLRNFVLDFPVAALIFADELKGRTRAGEVSDCIESQIGPERIATKKPRETRTRVVSRRAIAGDQPSTEKGIIHQPLNHTDTRPVICCLDLGIGKR